MAYCSESCVMRPYLEQLPWVDGSSIALLNRRLDTEIPFQWHHHPEYELTLTLNSRGQRFIGDHVGEYGACDLVLVGPNLPHTWASRGVIEDGPHVAQVVWFHPDWAQKVVGDFAEFKAIGALLARAGRGLAFPQSLGQALRQDIVAIFDQSPAEQMLSVMRVLDRIARAECGEPLASVAVQQDGIVESRERIDRVLTHIHTHYATGIAMDELADVAALSVSGLHRMMRKHTHGTLSEYVMGLRIGDACARLSGTDQPIAHIAHSVGYGALANFNRQFKVAKGMTPRAYRELFRSN